MTALSKAISVASTGVDATTWRIREKTENYTDETVRVSLLGYVDGASDPITSKEVVISGASYSKDMNEAAIQAALITPVVTEVSSAEFTSASIVADD